MKNKTSDLRNLLFEQLEILGDRTGELDEDDLQNEIRRTRAMVSVAETIIESDKVTVEAMKVMVQNGIDVSDKGKKLLEIGTGQRASDSD